MLEQVSLGANVIKINISGKSGLQYIKQGVIKRRNNPACQSIQLRNKKKIRDESSRNCWIIEYSDIQGLKFEVDSEYNIDGKEQFNYGEVP